MGLSRELVAEVRRLDEHGLRQLLILAHGLLSYADGRLGPVTADGGELTVTMREEHVRCGRDTCTTCPHGPYWYAYYRENGRTRKRYIGRHLAGQPLEPVVPDLPAR
jgi:hypothetical protein